MKDRYVEAWGDAVDLRWVWLRVWLGACPMVGLALCSPGAWSASGDASTVSYSLASDDAAFITGAHIVVDGGLLIGPRHSWDPEAPSLSSAIRAIANAPTA